MDELMAELCCLLLPRGTVSSSGIEPAVIT
jgi:hypothetical protein